MISKKTQAALGFFTLILGALILYKLFVWGINLFGKIEPRVGAALIAGSATILVSVVTVMFSKKQEHKVEIENQLREKKVPVYENIIEFIFLITFAEKIGKKKPSEQEMVRFFADTTKDLVIWGSQETVIAFGDFREKIMKFSSDSNDPTEIMAVVEDLLFALRKDLGHKNFGVQRGDLLRLYINDIESHFPRKKLNQ